MAGLFFRQKRNIPKEDLGKNAKTILILFTLSLLFFLLARFIPEREAEQDKKMMIEASQIMKEAIDVLQECQEEKGISIDKRRDPNQTGLIGLEVSQITTSLGSLEAKRTTTNPNFAGLIVFLLKEAGVKEGETIAVGASGSFPALIVAVFSAAKAMDLKPLVISSLGASQWGANRADFFWLRMHECLSMEGVFDDELIALSLGGEKDSGEDMSVEGRSLLTKEIRESGILFIDEPYLERNVELRMSVYEENAGNNKIKAFINIGGSWSNMGTDLEILKLKPGLVKIRSIPTPDKRGIIHEMAVRKIPVIHLLYIKGFVHRYGLPWDPIPLPRPGDGKIYQMIRQKQPTFIFLAALYLILVSLVVVLKKAIR